MMKCIRAKKLLKEVDIAVKKINGFKSASELEKAYLAKFLVVYIFGAYEESVECIINEQVSKLGSIKIDKYVEKLTSKTFRNPNFSTVSGLLGMFDDKWKKKLNKLPNQSML
jgi:hypothetical protein